MRLRYTRRAAAELDQILSYIDKQSPQGAARVKARIKAILDMVALNPFAGKRTNLRGLRRVVVQPYPDLLFYTVSESEVVVQGVRHAARRPSSSPS